MGPPLIEEKKRAFAIHEALTRIERAVRPFPPAMLFQLAEEGHSSVFVQLDACILSIRTRDETSLAVVKNFFQCARTPEQIGSLSLGEIDALIQHGILECQRNGQL